jgi:hypothetical protein
MIARSLPDPNMTGWTDTAYNMTIFESSTKHRAFSIYVKMNQTGSVDLPIQNYNSAFNYFAIIE